MSGLYVAVAPLIANNLWQLITIVITQGMFSNCFINAPVRHAYQMNGTVTLVLA